LVLFFRKEQDSSFSEEKEAKRLLFLIIGLKNPGLGRKQRPMPFAAGSAAVPEVPANST
jgi:hypothetical protein